MKKWSVFNLPSSYQGRCKACGAPFEEATFYGAPVGPPEPESLLVCAMCGVLYQWQEGGRLERLEKIPDDAHPETRRQIAEIRKAVFLSAIFAGAPKA